MPAPVETWTDAKMGQRQNRFTLEFATYASTSGWTEDALSRFCADRGISSDERSKHWPAGVRSLGWELNELADHNMLDQFTSSSVPCMGDIFLSRFLRNQDLKPAVAKLALSDLRHPIDTLARTRRTARLMWQCYGRPRWSSRLGRGVDTWLLLFAYSLCVVVWLLDKSPGHGITRRTIRGSLLVIGLR